MVNEYEHDIFYYIFENFLNDKTNKVNIMWSSSLPFDHGTESCFGDKERTCHHMKHS